MISSPNALELIVGMNVDQTFGPMMLFGAGGVAVEVIGDSALALPPLDKLLVGFGTVLGGGCTSGHGVCGVARFSRRPLIATGTFMLFGLATFFVTRHISGVAG